MTTRDRLVQAMTELLRRQGYHATSVKQLVDLSGAPMGSLYHHFPGGKRELAAAALRASGAAHIQLLPLVMDLEPDPVAAVAGFFATAAREMEAAGWMNMCPVGTVAAEVADTEPELREVAGEVLAGWHAEGCRYLVGRGFSPEAAEELTPAIIAGLEGAFMVARTQRSGAAVTAMGKAVGARAAELFRAQPAGVTAARGAVSRGAAAVPRSRPRR